jgi:cation transport regulator
VEFAMPYFSNHELPSTVRAELPGSAQNTYREAYNRALQAYAGNAERKHIADRIAWQAVKSKYEKVGGEWVLLHTHASHTHTSH